MQADKAFYLERLYPLQDEVLAALDKLPTEFYLTGGTAVSRGYLNHRFSDDLDMFVNRASPFDTDPLFKEWCGLIVDALKANNRWRVDENLRGQYFMRLLVWHGDVMLKLECVNDVPSHIGKIAHHPALGKLDSPENILANKITALRDRNEPKDIADFWGLTKFLGLSAHQAIVNARTKSSGLYYPDLARRLCTATRADWERVAWINPPDPDTYLAELIEMGDNLILSGAQ